ncbi:MAG: alcohol dehydrogenase [Pseudonocardiales bacterium]|nr:MAG: alcohol dehydrogenase [Pseudonocardiales bacterium]
MKAMFPDRQRSVRLGDASEPTPEADEAVLAVQAYSVNRGETLLLEAPRDGWRPGKDVAGTVTAAAADGSGPPVGARVVAHVPDSGWAERVAAATSTLAVLPDEVTTETAAALPLAGLTALRLLRKAGPLVGRRLLITGASGGVGHYVTELATAAGAEVTAVSATAERGSRLREFGARTVTDVADAEAWFDVAMESVGGESFTASRARVRPSGVVIWFGQASRVPITVDMFDWIDGTVGSRIEPFNYALSDSSDGADLASLVRLVQLDRLHPEIGSVRPWSQTPQIIDEIRGRVLRGNAVLAIA